MDYELLFEETETKDNNYGVIVNRPSALDKFSNKAMNEFYGNSAKSLENVLRKK